MENPDLAAIAQIVSHERPIIGVTGLKRSGKDTFAKLAREILPFYPNFKESAKKFKLEEVWRIDSFAAPLRNFAHDMFGVTEENRHNVIDGLKITGREFLQLVGTEVCRQIDSEIWLKSLISRTKTLNHLIITDVRFDNEASFIRRNGGMIVHIVRPDSGNSAMIDKHPSEAGISSALIDYSITNGGKMQDYERKIAEFCDWYDYRHCLEWGQKDPENAVEGNA